MDKKKVFTYFLVGFSLVVLIIGTALIIIGSLALNDSKNCSKNSDNLSSTKHNILASTVPSTMAKSTPSSDIISTYFIRVNMSLENLNNFYSKYNIESQGQEVISKVNKALSSSSKPDILSVLSIDNDCKSEFTNSYNIILILSYLSNAPSLENLRNLLSKNNINVLEIKNLVNNYIPNTNKDGTCYSFCDATCSNSKPTSPTISTKTIPLNITNVTISNHNITTTASSNPVTIPSCSNIIAVDSSSILLNSQYYQMELGLIQNFSRVITEFDNLLLVSYSNETQIVQPFGSMKNANDFTNSISSITQKPGSQLSVLLSTLLNYLENRKTETINTVIMVTKYIPTEINKSIPLVKKLKAMGQISFIILGTGAKEEELQPLNPTNIIVYDFATCDEDKFDNKFKSFINCPFEPYFYNKLDGSQVYPCKSAIAFSVDGSLALEKEKFEAEINGLTSDDVITNEWNNFERISLVKYYTSADIIVNFNSVNTKEEFFRIVRTVQQTGDRVNLANLLAALESGFVFYPQNEVQNHFIFLSSNITTKDIQISIPYATNVKNKGSLNFIVFGKDLIPALNYLTSNDRILYWDYTTTEANESLKNFITNRITCS
ncbi:von Willebrand factor, type A domain-containing protein [Strongyloides ratti]|uniref:von Willebrand factor, type A domain-containing protein n=1 Tax=Strongyloides ratti TaxID=34506 RepID=A0A090KXP3_STRRB|nr:von Willebrand factor, type A domain-containing protein [Strongyloides ratti]CEF62176.1 von Willebrand factor, type A domain-containing protein [Strongyloides ratti]